MNELIEQFGQVAWEAALRQVQLDVWSDVAGGIVILVISVVLYRVLLGFAKKDGCLPLLAVIALLTAVLALIPFTTALKKSLNPEFYAIEKFIPGKN